MEIYLRGGRRNGERVQVDGDPLAFYSPAIPTPCPVDEIEALSPIGPSFIVEEYHRKGWLPVADHDGIGFTRRMVYEFECEH